MRAGAMSWEELLVWRVERREAALRAAEALERGDPEPAHTLLRTWSFARDTAKLTALLDALRAAILAPPGWVVDATLSPDLDRLPRPAELGSGILPWDFRQEILDHCARTRRGAPPPGRREILAWALDELSFVGSEVQRRRDQWTARRWREREKRDAVAAKLWAAWLAGGPAWDTMASRATRELILRPAAESFAQELRRMGRAPAVPPETLRELERDLFYLLMLPPRSGKGEPGIRDLALRVLETAGGGPLHALGGALPDRALGLAASCATNRGAGARSAEAGWPHLSRAEGRASALWRDLREEASTLDRALDLHSALRLVRAWGHANRPWQPDPSRAVLVANRGRGRARLRALAAAQRGTWIIEALLGLPALWSRTRAAARWFGADLARRERASGFALSLDEPVLPACPHTDLPPPPFGAEQLAEVDCWLFLVATRGRWEILQRWALQGEASHDATWGRLLSRALPEALTDAGRRGAGGATYDRLRDLLRQTWEARVDALAARVEGLLQRPLRSAAARERWLDTWWRESVPRPSGPLFDKSMVASFLRRLLWILEQS